MFNWSQTNRTERLIALVCRCTRWAEPHTASRVEFSLIRSRRLRQVNSSQSSRERMTTTCSKPGVPVVAGNLSNGSDDPPTLSAESLCSGEIDTVEHDIVHPRDDRREHASLPAQFQSREHGLVSLTDRPIKTINAPINEPRTSHRLTTEYAIPTRY